MKIWIKYGIAIVVGVLVGLVAPIGAGTFFYSLADIALNLGRYIFLPLFFFSIAPASFELYEDKKLHHIWFKTIALSVAALFIFSLTGIAGAFAFSPERIPLSQDAVSDVGSVPSITAIASALLPQDALTSLGNFNFILPAALFALMIGLGFSFDKLLTKPVFSLFDALSRIMWQLNSFFVEILPLPLIMASAARMAMVIQTPRIRVFGSLFLVLAIEFLLAALVILPLILWLFCKKNPYKILFALTAPALLAFVSGNTYVQAGVAAKHMKESLGLRRRAGSAALPIALTFGRAGTAMVTATAFVTVIHSYSELGLSFSAIVWMAAIIPLIALLLGAAPSYGPVVALTSLCAMYGRGFESGYVLLVPVALPLAMFAAMTDSLVMAAAVYIVADNEGYIHHKEMRHFI